MSNETDDLEILTGTMLILEKHGGLPSRDMLAALDQMGDRRKTVEQVDEQVEDMIATKKRIERMIALRSLEPTEPRGRLKVVE